MIDYRRMRSPMRQQLSRAQRRARRDRRPHFATPRQVGRRPLAKQKRGLLIAFAVALLVNAAVIALHGPAVGIEAPSNYAAPPPSSARPDVELEQAATPAAARISLLDGLPQRDRPSPSRSAQATPAAKDKAAPHAIPAQAQKAREIKAQLKRGQTLAGALTGLGLQRASTSRVVSALSTQFDFRRARPGDHIEVHLNAAGQVERVEYRAQAEGRAADRIIATRHGASMQARRQPVETTTRVALVSGEIASSLYDSIVATGEGTSLIAAFTDVFGWEIDFHREVRAGDRFRMLVEKRYADGAFVGYGRLLAAEYKGRGHGYQAFYFRDKHSAGYFNARGESMRKAFLRAPVGLVRITSRFGKRKHPILGYTRAHDGIDYGVPRGTPVWSVGDGTVIARGKRGGYGNVVKVRHPNGYETVYAHLSRFAKIRVGQKVEQKQIIGYCGSTGLSTGPHVHFGMKRGGHYINPLKQKFTRATPVARSSRGAFARQVALLQAQLDAVEIALAPAASGSQG